MSKFWRFRVGAYHSSQHLCFGLAQLRSHVSIDGQRLAYYRLFAQHRRYLACSRLRSHENDDLDGIRITSRLSRGRLSAIPSATMFVSPFEKAVTRRSRASGDDVAQAQQRSSVGKLANTTGNASYTHHTPSGLGSWVIVPDSLKTSAGSEQDSASRSHGGYVGTSRDNTALERVDESPDQSTRDPEHSLLALTLDYTKHLHDPLSNSVKDGTTDLLELIENVFAPLRMTKLELRGFQVEDVVCWGWVLAADTADLAVSRMHIITSLATHSRDASPMSDMPYFMFTIILRSRRLSSSSLTLLVNVLLMRLQHGQMSDSMLPDARTSMIILIRLMRHARRVAPGQLTAIADLSGSLLAGEYITNKSSPKILQRLTYNYNRLLSLLSIATPQHPFRYVPIQQQAQFNIIRQMASMNPALPVTREGYQALAKVQLAHKKTAAEQEWARTKADSWPPWRENKLGISEDMEYSGSQSRAADVLRRQIEAGYMQTNWDKAATVLAGWDTDKSPTIQKRTVISKAPLTWLQSLLRSLASSGDEKIPGSTEDARVWTARIRATRTVREAWSCFCAYDTASVSGGRTQEPYHAMFEKLAGRLQTADACLVHLPGDGREVHPQPVSPRHHLYVPVEPPGFHAFYNKLRLDGIKPAGRLLAMLLDHARTLREGIKYLEESRTSEIKGDVMLNAHKYEAEFICSTLKFVQPFVIASFLSMLWRTRKGSGKLWYRPTSQAITATSESPKLIDPGRISAHTYVLDFMGRIQPTTQICNKVLETIVRDLKMNTDLASLNGGWQALQSVLHLMAASNLESDMATFYTVASGMEYLVEANSEFKFKLRRGDQHERISYGSQLAKRLFVQAVVDSTSNVVISSETTLMSPSSRLRPGPISKGGYPGRMAAGQAAAQTKWLPCSADSSILEVPSPAALHLLMRLLTKDGEARSILTLLRWMDRFVVELMKVKAEVANGERQMRFALCVAAMALEDLAVTRPELSEDIGSVRILIEENVAWGGWPKDDELERYLLNDRLSNRHK